jgi:hypothetical protein
MRLASTAHYLLLALAACAPGAADSGELPDEPGELPDAPDVEPPAADPWVSEVYEPVMQEAAQLDVGEFLAKYPGPEYVGQLSYDPTSAAGLAEIRAYAKLGAEHDAVLAKNGFVAVGDSPTFTFASTYLDLYFNDLPVFISADSMLHALHKSFDSMLLDFERQVLIPEVDRMLAAMHKQLGSELKGLPEGLASAGRDLDLYLTVARTLLGGAPVATVSGDADLDEEVARILTAVDELQPKTLALFGASSLYDYSQMEPRGHYEDEPELQRYFRTMIWLGRTDMAMVVFDEQQRAQIQPPGARRRVHHQPPAGGQRGAGQLGPRRRGARAPDRRARQHEPAGHERSSWRETGVGSLAELAAASDEDLYKALIDGKYGLQRIMSQIMYTDPTGAADRAAAGVPAARPALHAGFARVQQRHLRPRAGPAHRHQGQAHAAERARRPVRARQRRRRPGPRAGARALRLSGHPPRDALPDRRPPAGLLGRDLLQRLARGDPHAQRRPPSFASQPEAMRTAAWADKNLNTQTASWAELRHDTLLYVKQSYSGGDGCEYPDAYVEPVPAFYARLAHLGQLGGEMVAGLEKDGFEVSRAQTFFANLSASSATSSRPSPTRSSRARR